MLGVSHFFSVSNYIEACLWGLLGLIILAVGERWNLSLKNRIRVFLVLVAFGLSDCVEAQTGAWWRPWWLLIWKVLCVGVLAVMTGIFLWRRRSQPR